MRHMLEKFKKKQGIATTADLIMIAGVFSLAGTTDSLAVKSLLPSFFKALPAFPVWARAGLYVAVAVPLYQCFLLIYGFLLGQFDFFWQREKRLGRRLSEGLTRMLRRILCVLRRQESETV